MAVPQINLLPDVKIALIKARMQRNVMLGVSFIVVIVCGAIMFLLSATLGTLVAIKSISDGRISEYEKTIKKEQRTGELNEYMTIQNQLSQISRVKKTQEQFSRIFDYLIKLNPGGRNNLSITSLKIAGNNDTSADSSGASGVISLSGTANDYAAMNVIKLTLEKAQLKYHTSDSDEVKTVKLFDSVTVVSSSINSGSDTNTVNFQLDLKYDPAAFAYDTVDPQVEIPSETVSDSRSNIPGKDKDKILFNGTGASIKSDSKSDSKKSNKSQNGSSAKENN